MDKIRNEYTRGAAQVGRLKENTRGKTEVVWTYMGGKMKSIFIVYWEKDAEDGTARKRNRGGIEGGL